VRALAARWRVAGALAVATVCAAWALAPPALSGPVEVRGVTDEWEHYSPERTDWSDRMRRNGATLARFFDGLPVRVAFLGGEASLVWHARPAVAIECETGLTDREIARQPLPPGRGRIGHEKHASLAYLADERAAHFAFHRNAAHVLGLDDAIPEVWADFGGVSARVLTWDAPLFAALRLRGARIEDFPARIDAFERGMQDRSDAEVRAFHDRARRFYFSHVRDPVREAPLIARLAASRDTGATDSRAGAGATDPP